MKSIFLLLPVLVFSAGLSLVTTEKLTSDPVTVESENGQYRVATEYDRGNLEFVPTQRFKLIDRTGSVIFERMKDGHTLFDVANNGRVVGIDFDGPISGRATLHFYGTGGIESGHAEIGFLSARTFTSDASRYIVNDGRQGLRVFAATGTELYNLGKGNWFAASGDGRIVALAQDAAILLFDGQSPVGEIPIASPFVREIKLSRDGSVLVFADRKDLYAYRVDGVKLLWHHHESNTKLNFISVDVAHDVKYVAAGLEEDKGRGVADRHSRGYVYLYDMQGAVKSRKEIKYSNWSAFIPDVDFTSENSLEVKTLDEVHNFKY